MMEPFIEKINNPGSLISFRLTNQALTTLCEIKQYKNLVTFTQIELDLSGNCLTKELKELKSLKFLRKLSLSSNHISGLWDLPKTLEYLNLSCNHISIFSLSFPRLLYLDLSCNLIRSLTEISGLSKLRGLYLGYNLVTSLESLTNFSSLLEIDLEHNLIDSVENMSLIVESKVLVFIIKNNPATM